MSRPWLPDMALRFDEAELQTELKAIEAEAIGWLPLSEGAYLHGKQLANPGRPNFHAG